MADAGVVGDPVGAGDGGGRGVGYEDVGGSGGVISGLALEVSEEVALLLVGEGLDALEDVENGLVLGVAYGWR